jgi:peptidoglycan/LPS O-acetylase OafA/YrhL
VNNKLNFLPQIEGLRALAVISVLLFHLEISNFFEGGFLGVDIFFTISGFLITTLLLYEYDEYSSISLKNFYLRRIRRLLPALLFLVLIVLLISGWLLPEIFHNTFSDSIAAIFYVSNWWQIFSNQSYFDNIERPPLLQHLWSLSIEEQFYVLWPVLFLLILKNFNRQFLIIFSLIIAILSTFLMSYYSNIYDIPQNSDSSRVYFGTDTHSMSILMGVFTASLFHHYKLKFLSISSFYKSLFDIFAIFLLIFIIFIIQFRLESFSFLFRGGFLLFSIGISLIIFSTLISNRFLYSFLSLNFFQYIGSRSYGLYIWHWPIYSLVRPHFEIPSNSFIQGLIRLTITFIIAELSYRFIEQPIRNFNKFTRKNLYISFFIILLCVVIFTIYKNMMPNIHNHKSDILLESLSVDYIKDLNTNISLNCNSSNITGFGDSVLLGASNYLKKSFNNINIDAKVGRQSLDGLKSVQDYLLVNHPPDIAILHIGSNGYLTESHVKKMIELLHNSKLIIIINISAPRKWEESNNLLLKKLVSENSKTILLDWKSLSESDVRYLADDKVHMNHSGAKALSMKIESLINFYASNGALSQSNTSVCY